ncbi:MAG: electron transfer flavoprotein subunit alpha/FixB family protein [Syntrophobacteraceae bacterium]|nr:electron transfer flavoprotein subunit alpha/FixB family protein [Syntrophobacteraceae bacterium]
MSEILLLVEAKDGALDKKSLELMQGALGLGRQLGVATCAVVAGSDTARLAESAASFGLDKVYRLEHPLLAGFQPDAWVKGLEWLCGQVNPGIFLLSHSFVGKEVGPRLACRLNTALTTDCLGLSVDPGDGLLVRTKPIYGGNAIASLKCEGVPQMATVRKNAFEPVGEAQSASAIVEMVPDIGEDAIRVKSIKMVEQEVVELDKANVVISGGRGIEAKEDFDMLEALAAAMSKSHGNVMIGCSRPVVDKCWMSSDRQVGLTGTIIAPDTYIAVGISGAIQHLVGMIRSKKIVAINTDPGCNMFKVADYGVVGDYRDIIPALVKKLEEQR